jgi:hypothetical protein
MLTAHVNELRDAYLAARQRLKNGNGGTSAGNGTPEASLVNQLKASIARIEEKAKGAKR